MSIVFENYIELTPPKKYKIIEGVETMSKKEVKEVSAEDKLAKLERKNMVMSIALTIVVTAVVSFIGGMLYANAQHNATETKVQSAVEAVETTVKDETATVTPKG